MQNKSRTELKAMVTELGIEFSNRASKAELIELLTPKAETVEETAVEVPTSNETVVEGTKPLKLCAGSNSYYEDTPENFPKSRFGGKYSRAFLISKKLLAK